jgi:hypothetical protein
MPGAQTLAQQRAEIARRSRRGDAAGERAARAAYAEAKLAAYIEKVVSDAPDLTDEQRERLAVLLRPGAA